MSAPFYHVPGPGLSCDVPVGSDQDPDPPTKDSDPAADKRLSDGLLNRHRFSPSHKGSMRKEDFIYIWYSGLSRSIHHQQLWGITVGAAAVLLAHSRWYHCAEEQTLLLTGPIVWTVYTEHHLQHACLLCTVSWAAVGASSCIKSINEQLLVLAAVWRA